MMMIASQSRLNLKLADQVRDRVVEKENWKVVLYLGPGVFN
jgi:hypothetical protein